MTEQITIKLNKEKFRPLLEKLKQFSGTGMSDSDSDLVGKALFYSYRAMYKKHPDIKKTTFDVMTEQRNTSKPETLLEFLNDYYKFKKEGVKAFEN